MQSSRGGHAGRVAQMDECCSGLRRVQRAAFAPTLFSAVRPAEQAPPWEECRVTRQPVEHNAAGAPHTDGGHQSLSSQGPPPGQPFSGGKWPRGGSVERAVREGQVCVEWAGWRVRGSGGGSRRGCGGGASRRGCRGAGASRRGGGGGGGGRTLSGTSKSSTDSRRTLCGTGCY